MTSFHSLLPRSLLLLRRRHAIQTLGHPAVHSRHHQWPRATTALLYACVLVLVCLADLASTCRFRRNQLLGCSIVVLLILSLLYFAVRARVRAGSSNTAAHGTCLYSRMWLQGLFGSDSSDVYNSAFAEITALAKYELALALVRSIETSLANHRATSSARNNRAHC